MIRGRKFKIWFISTGLVLAVFLFYKMFGDTGDIKSSKTDYIIENDANKFLADSNSGQIGQARLEYGERARFETIDIKTGKLKRVVGFEKVLHKTGNEWILDKPYMNVYQENIRCNITADTGTVELENLEGSSPAPKQAVMKGNVVVHILGQNNRTDSFIYLNEVAFDSDRSMLWSNDDVNFVSEDADLMGRGLEIVYNNATNRMEFLKIKTVDYLNIKTLPEEKKTAKTEIKKTAKTETKSPVAKTVTTVESASKSTDTPQAAADDKKDDYRCLFRDNVRIEYKEEVVLADEVAVSHLLWSQKKDEQPSQSQSPASPNSTDVKPAVAPQPVIPTSKKTVIATVRCSGPMIVRPVDATDYENWKPAEFKGFYNLDKKVLVSLGQKNLLIGQKVDYDVATETASVNGLVDLVFYPQIETDKGKQKVPFVISAKKSAQFVVPKKQAVFSGNVKGRFVKQTPQYDEENAFYGSKLIADFAEKEASQDIMASSDISHITVLGPGVRLETVRTLGETKLSHVRLKSERIDYDRATEDIIATGKGKIEYGNTAKNYRSSSDQNKLDKPCYTLVEGFTKLVWNTNAMHIRATSEKTAGIHIGYLPILETGYGQKVTIDTKQIDIDYFEPIPGKSQLKKLKATGGIVYHEQGGNEFAGKELNYNPTEDYMTVSGTKEMPCMLNGVFTEGIEYNLKTGTANAVLRGGVGIMPVRE